MRRPGLFLLTVERTVGDVAVEHPGHTGADLLGVSVEAAATAYRTVNGGTKVAVTSNGAAGIPIAVPRLAMHPGGLAALEKREPTAICAGVSVLAT